MKTPFTFADGPLLGCTPANGLSVDSALVGAEPTPGDRRFICLWRRDKPKDGKFGLAQGLYRFVKGEDGKVTAKHVPGPDDKAFDVVTPPADTPPAENG